MTRTLGVGVLGAGGTIAPAVVRDLAEAHGLGKAEVRAVDAQADLSGDIAGLDVLVNAASYRVNLDATTFDVEIPKGVHAA